MRFLAALLALSSSAMAGTGVQLLGTQQVSNVQQVIQTIKVQDAIVSWEPKVEYQEREIQIEVPAPIQFSPQVVQQSQPVQYYTPQVSVPQQTVQMPTVIQQAVPMIQQAVPMIQSEVQYCPNGQCTQPTYQPTTTYQRTLPPAMPEAGRHVIEYQRAQVGLNGQVLETHNTPLRTLCTIRRALRNAPSPPSLPGNGGSNFR